MWTLQSAYCVLIRLWKLVSNSAMEKLISIAFAHKISMQYALFISIDIHALAG